jgi:hypothetical protein
MNINYNGLFNIEILIATSPNATISPNYITWNKEEGSRIRGVWGSRTNRCGGIDRWKSGFGFDKP